MPDGNFSVSSSTTLLFLTDERQQRVRGPPSKIVRRGKLGAANHARNYFIELNNQGISTEGWMVSVWMANGKQYGSPEPMFYFADDPQMFAEWFQNYSETLLMFC